jgi:hypothetical protein
MNPKEKKYTKIMRLALLSLFCIALPGLAGTAYAAGPDVIGGMGVQVTSLTINSIPSGATLFIDGTNAGVTPFSTTILTAGQHSLLLRLAGYTDYSDTVTTAARAPVVKLYNLMPVTTAAPIRISPHLIVTVTPTPARTMVTPYSVTPTPTAALPLRLQTVAPRTSVSMMMPGSIPEVAPTTSGPGNQSLLNPSRRTANLSLQDMRPFFGVQKQTVGLLSRNVYYTSMRPESALGLGLPSKTLILIAKSSTVTETCAQHPRQTTVGGQTQYQDIPSADSDCENTTTDVWGESANQFNVSQDLNNYRFKWASDAVNVTDGRFQVSIYPFPDRLKNWATPPGLVAYGTVHGRPADKGTVFTIPIKGLLNLSYSTDPLDLDPAPSPHYTLGSPGGFLSTADYDLFGGKTGTDIVLFNSTGVGIEYSTMHLGPLTLSAPSGVTGYQTMQGMQANLISDHAVRRELVPLALSTKMAWRDRTYYIRIVALGADGNPVDTPSPDVELDVRGAPLYMLPGEEKTMAWVSDGQECHHGEFDTVCSAADVQDLNRGFIQESTALAASWSGGVSMSSNALNQLLFKWTSAEPDVNAGEWQLLTTNYPYDETDWEHPHGFVAEGPITMDKYFQIDLQHYNLPSGTYYLRVLPLGTGNTVLWEPSYPLKITVTDAPVTTVINCDAQNLIKDRHPPSISLISYTPIQSASPDANLHFKLTRGCSQDELNQGFIKAIAANPACMYGVHNAGDPIYFAPHESSWWDDFVNAIGDVFSFIGDLVNWVSDAWNSIKDFAVNLAVNLVPGCSAIPDVCKSCIGGGLDAGLVALGVPPTLPTFSDVENMGTDYMVQMGIDEIGANDVLSPDDVRTAAHAVVTSHEQDVGTGGPNVLIPDPDYQHKPAYILVQVSNPNSVPTDPSVLTYSDHLLENYYCDYTYSYPVCPTTFAADKTLADEGKIPQSPEDRLFQPREMPIPSLQPGQTIQIPILLTEDYGYWANDTGYGGPGVTFPDQAFTENYRDSRFTISINTPDMRDPDPLSEIVYFGTTPPPASACPATKVHAPADGWIQTTIPPFTVTPPSTCYSGSVSCVQPYQNFANTGNAY